jgi:hypothetical protein
MIGVGMPAAIYLDEFGWQVYCAFGSYPYLVGSALKGKEWRDVDVRLLIDDDEYESMGLGQPGRGQENAKWTSLVMAYSALGAKITGLPIDFQIQQMTYANVNNKGPRSALGILRWIAQDALANKKESE